MRIDDKYDVAIIGAGIGGLVCGCYLAKNGMKVLISEQHSRPGGYCSSFTRNGFVFDSSIHYIKFTKGKSLISKIIEDFRLDKHVSFKKLDPSDLIITPSGEVTVNSDSDKTMHNFISLFPRESKNIINFFELLNTKNIATLYSKTRDRTLSDLMKIYFKDKNLIGIFNGLLMNIGLPINKVDALKAYFFFKEFFFDKSYYPMGGMQKLSDSLAQVFQSYGGKILYSRTVDKIITKNNRCYGFGFDKDIVFAKYIVSNMDPHSTFLKCIGKDKISKNLYKRIKHSIPSMSAFVVYLGMSDRTISRYCTKNSIWYFPSASFNKIYNNIEHGNPVAGDDYLICSIPSSYDNSCAPNNGKAVAIFSGASFNTKEYWDVNRDRFTKMVIERTKFLFPNISDCLKVVSTATPHTLLRYTHNINGACYGLASLREQMRKTFMPQKTEIENLLMAGHWVTHGIGQGGLSMAAFSGMSAAKNIIKTNQKAKK